MVEWWARAGQDGHWYLVVSKAEIKHGFDPWGYPPGGLRACVLSSVPKPPSLITSEQIARELFILGTDRPLGFLKVVQRYLRELRDGGLVRSVRYSNTLELGWHLTQGTADKMIVGSAKVGGIPKRGILRIGRKGGSDAGASVHLQGRVLDLVPLWPATITAHEIAHAIEVSCRLRPGEALTAVEAQLANLARLKIAESMMPRGAVKAVWFRSSR